MRDLIDGYFALRRESEGLKKEGERFEGAVWRQDGLQAVRKAGDWELSIYRCEGQIEACVKGPDGTFATFS